VNEPHFHRFLRSNNKQGLHQTSAHASEEITPSRDGAFLIPELIANHFDKEEANSILGYSKDNQRAQASPKAKNTMVFHCVTHTLHDSTTGVLIWIEL